MASEWSPQEILEIQKGIRERLRIMVSAIDLLHDNSQLTMVPVEEMLKVLGSIPKSLVLVDGLEIDSNLEELLPKLLLDLNAKGITHIHLTKQLEFVKIEEHRTLSNKDVKTLMDRVQKTLPARPTPTLPYNQVPELKDESMEEEVVKKTTTPEPTLPKKQVNLTSTDLKFVTLSGLLRSWMDFEEAEEALQFLNPHKYGELPIQGLTKYENTAFRYSSFLVPTKRAIEMMVQASSMLPFSLFPDKDIAKTMLTYFAGMQVPYVDMIG